MTSLMPDEPLKHLRRVAPPWADQGVTVCGNPVDRVTIIEWDEAKTLVNKIGRTRAQFVFCQTCLSLHAQRALTPDRWETSPAAVIADYCRHANRRSPMQARIDAELLALADLVTHHRDEFNVMVEGRVRSADFARRRNEKAKAALEQARPGRRR